MTDFDTLADEQQASFALAAINRVLAGIRMHQGDYEALIHAAELVGRHIPMAPGPDLTQAQLDAFDSWVLGEKGGAA